MTDQSQKPNNQPSRSALDVGRRSSMFTAGSAPRHHVVFWLALIGLAVLALAVFRDILLPFISGMVLAYFLNPVADQLEQRGLSRTLASGLVVGLLATALILAVVVVVPLVAGQLKQFALALPGELERLKGVLEQVARDRLGSHFPNLEAAIERAFADFQSSLGSTTAAVLSTLWNRGLALVNVVSFLLITPLVVFYLLVDWHPMLRTRRDLAAARPCRRRSSQLADDIEPAVAAFIRGQGTICLLLGLFYAVGLSLVGLQVRPRRSAWRRACWRSCRWSAGRSA